MRKILTLSLGVVATIICGSANAAQWNQQSFTGGLNTVHIYNPDTLSPIGNGKSLFIVLRGCLQPASAFKTSNLNKVADEYGMVIAAANPNNPNAFADCWQYWTGAHSRTSGESKSIISTVQTIIEDKQYNIDPNQVYIGGLSSGGAMAMITGCYAPDIFAGMALDAAPSAGTGVNGAFSHEGTPELTAQRCESYAGANSDYFDTQITTTAYGTTDYTVPKTYGLQNAKAMAIIYGSSQTDEENKIQEFSDVIENTWTDGRVSLVELGGVGHAWPGGTGASGSYIDGSSANYGLYAAEFFKQNNKRVVQVKENVTPKLNGLNIYSAEDIIYVNGSADDEDGTIASISIQVSGPENRTETITDINVASRYFDVEFTDLANGDYTIKITAVDNEGAEISSDDFEEVIDVVEEDNIPPTIDTFDATTNDAGSCLVVDGTASDADGTVESVMIAISGIGEYTSQVEVFGDSYKFHLDKCLDANSYQITAKAIDDDQTESAETGEQTVLIIETDNKKPEITVSEIIKANGCITFDVTATDSDGYITAIGHKLNDGRHFLQMIPGEPTSTSYTVNECGLDAGEHKIRIKAIDNQGHETAETLNIELTEEEEEENAPPKFISFVAAAATNDDDGDKDCIVALGTVTDADSDDLEVIVYIDDTAYPAELKNDNSFEVKQCDLAANEYTVKATANDSNNPVVLSETTGVTIEETINAIPEITHTEVNSQGNCFGIMGEASDSDGTISDISLKINGVDYPVDFIPGSTVNFGAQKCDLASGKYTGTVIATDNDGAKSASSAINFTIATDEIDTDGDGVEDSIDNCPVDSNSDQKDVDGDGIGDTCDSLIDTDGDGVADSTDNCPTVSNPNQKDVDGDGIGDVCDPLIDTDGDGIADSTDNCPAVSNPDQKDVDGDGIGDVCDSLIDTDGDGVADSLDNCPVDSNSNQADADGDGIGDVCDSFIDADSDSDGVADSIDNCPVDSNSDQADIDEDGIGDVCDSLIDTDGDGIADSLDNCPVDSNSNQADVDEDGIGDVCDSLIDSDNDGVADEDDAFPEDPEETVDTDGDGVGDNADAFPEDPKETIDTDGDGVGDNADAFPEDPTKTTVEIGESNDGDTDGGDGSGGGGGAPSLIFLALGLIALRLRKRS